MQVALSTMQSYLAAEVLLGLGLLVKLDISDVLVGLEGGDTVRWESDAARY